MNLELFIAKRLYGMRKGARYISRPAVAIAQWGVAVGVAVMFVSICIIVGFKQNIRDKIIGFGGDIQVMSYESMMGGAVPVEADDSLISVLANIDGVKSIAPFAVKPGMILANGEYEGLVVKGIGSDYDSSFLEAEIVAGEMPLFTDSVASNSLLVSQIMATRLGVDVGDKINLYFIENGIRARRMVVAAIYETHLTELDETMAVTDIYTVRRLNGWEGSMVSALEISVEDYDELENVREAIHSNICSYTGSSRYYVPTIEELYPSLFAWLAVLDQTVWLILVLVLFIAGFTMVSGLLILILEKSNFIGVMKAVGARNISIGKVFIYYACIVIGKGLIYGNVLALLLCVVQFYFKPVMLDPEMYYMDSVPIEFTWLLIPMNLGMFLLSVLMLVLPSMLIAKIEPTKAIKFE